jgi:4-diphosphocytidyl-2-C-methyl-D-erythritol kinase
VSGSERVLRALAPAKVNLGLFVGPTRAGEAKHELATVMQSVSLADELTMRDAPDEAVKDALICPGVEGPVEQNLAAAALRAFRRRTGWDGPPQLVRIDKRIPVAAGLGGGSADAAAVLRLAVEASGLGDRELLLEIAEELGADVPAQVEPGRWLARGAGEQLLQLPPPRVAFGVLILPGGFELSTAAVYGEADRLGVARSSRELDERARELTGALEHGAPLPAAGELLHNDLQRAAASLRPEIAETLRLLRRAGGDPVMVSGSGPTVIGLFSPAGGQEGEGLALARLAAQALGERDPAPVCAVPVEASFGEVREL